MLAGKFILAPCINKSLLTVSAAYAQLDCLVLGKAASAFRFSTCPMQVLRATWNVQQHLMKEPPSLMLYPMRMELFAWSTMLPASKLALTGRQAVHLCTCLNVAQEPNAQTTSFCICCINVDCRVQPIISLQRMGAHKVQSCCISLGDLCQKLQHFLLLHLGFDQCLL